MAKSTLQSIAAVIASHYGLKSGEATAFVAAFFEQIRLGLEEDKLVKVRGLGTFKLQPVKARESVNVNTGERVVISGHDKMAFTPDNAMKELVNRPFADFETTFVKEGVDLETIPTPVEEETLEDNHDEEETASSELVEQEQTAPTAIDDVASAPEETAEKTTSAEEIPAEPEETVVPSTEESPAEAEKSQPERIAKPSRPLTASERFSQLMEEEPVAESPVKEAVDSSNEAVEKPKEDEAAALPTIHEEPKSPKSSQLSEELPAETQETQADKAQKHTSEETPTHKQPINQDSEKAISESEILQAADAPTPPVWVDSSEEEEQRGGHGRIILLTIVAVLTICAIGAAAFYFVQTDSKSQQMENVPMQPTPKPSAPKRVAAKDTVRKVAENQPQEATIPTEKQATPPTPSQQKVTPEGIDLEQANSYRAIRYGAYRIVGIDKTIVLKKGDTMEKYCKRTLGKDMMGYFEAVNGSARRVAGDTVLVPKVELRPEYRK